MRRSVTAEYIRQNGGYSCSNYAFLSNATRRRVFNLFGQMPAPSKCSLGTASWVQLALAIVTENIYCSGRIRSVENPSAYIIFLVAHILLYITNNERIIIYKAPETGEWVCGVGVGVRRGLRGASVPRWSA